MKNVKNIIVAGCGPAGMMAAITAARNGAAVTILEGMDKPGKKLLLTGNGRCNLTNLDPKLPTRCRSLAESDRFPGNASPYQKASLPHPENAVSYRDTSSVHPTAEQILRQFSVSDTLDFFHSLGLLTTDKNGYVYPHTGQSSSVLELLLAEMKRLKIKLKFSEKIQKIEQNGEGQWNVSTETWTYPCDHLILCCGSRAASATGSDGSGYSLAKQAGHRVSPVLPALTALTADKKKFFTACAGVRCQARITLYRLADPNTSSSGASDSEHDKKNTGRRADVFLAEDTGELQLTENGISGIVVFQVSRYASIALDKKERVRAAIDFLPELSLEELKEWLHRIGQYHGQASVSGAFAGLLPRKLLLALLEQTKIKPGSPAGTLSEEQLEKLARSIKDFSVPVTGTRSFDQCQVCTGGVLLSEVNAQTLESKKRKGLYFAGEILDVDGPCGGYNLQWAWSSGYAAGRAAARNY